MINQLRQETMIGAAVKLCMGIVKSFEDLLLQCEMPFTWIRRNGTPMLQANTAERAVRSLS